MKRRTFFPALSVAAAALALTREGSGAQAAAAQLLPKSYDKYEDWLREAREAGMGYLKEFGVADTERFMKLLALWACAMPTAPDPAWQTMEGANAYLEMATLSAGRPFVVSAFRMAPGCVLPLHCHPGGGGITMCTSGSVAMQHFELCEGQPSYSATGAIAEVRQMHVSRIADGQITWFTPSRYNLHQFHAGPQGAVGIEIAVQWQGGGQFSFLRLREPAPVDRFDPDARLAGKWVGMKLADAYS